MQDNDSGYEKMHYANELIARHRGAANEVVFGALIGGYVKKRMYSAAFETYSEVSFSGSMLSIAGSIHGCGDHDSELLSD
jgi:pentatricopeptide repeat protein